MSPCLFFASNICLMTAILQLPLGQTHEPAGSYKTEYIQVALPRPLEQTPKRQLVITVILYEKAFKSKLSGNEVYDTTPLIFCSTEHAL